MECIIHRSAKSTRPRSVSPPIKLSDVAVTDSTMRDSPTVEAEAPSPALNMTSRKEESRYRVVPQRPFSPCDLSQNEPFSYKYAFRNREKDIITACCSVSALT